MSARGRLVVVGRGAPERGGIPSFMAMLVDEQQTLGYDVVFVNLAEGARREGGRLSWGNATRTFTDAARVFRVARRGDVVHVHSALAPTVTGLRAGLLVRAARLRGARTVVHAHGGRLIDSLTSRARRALARRTLAPADAVIAVSTRVRDVLLDSGLDPARVRYLANGVSVERFADVTSSRPHHPPRVLFVGGLTPRKGVLDLVAASTMLLDEGVHHELWLVGGMPDEGAGSQQQVLDAVPPHAEMVGMVDPVEMAATYAQVDVFCLPSWWEAMPLTVLEAEAPACPSSPPMSATSARWSSTAPRATWCRPRTGSLSPTPCARCSPTRSDAPDGPARAGARARRLRGGARLLRDLAAVLDEVRAS